MNNKQKIAIIGPIILLGVMYPVFQYFSGVFGERIGWYLGLALYWLVWGGAFSLWMIGKEGLLEIIRPRRLSRIIFLLMLFPLVMSSVYKLIPGMGYQNESLWMFLLYLSTAFGNGFFEEVLWRGVYMRLFPDNIIFRIVWAQYLVRSLALRSWVSVFQW